MTTTPMLFAIIDVGGGWTPQIVKVLPPLAECYAFMDYQEMKEVSVTEEFDVVILLGNAALPYLSELHRDDFSGDIILLSDLHTGEEPGFAEKYPGVRVLSKTAVANGSMLLP